MVTNVVLKSTQRQVRFSFKGLELMSHQNSSHSMKPMIIKSNRYRFMKHVLLTSSRMFWRAITVLFLPMVKQVLVKHIL
jgi:hypothetical protein